MSAFVCMLSRSGAPVDAGQLRRLARSLEGRGMEIATFCRGPVGIAVSRRGDDGSTRRHGPLVDPDTGKVVAVAGRFSTVGDEPAAGVGGGEPIGGAALALGRSEDRGFLSRLTGPFALLTADPERGEVSVARDHLGALQVHYFLDPSRLIVSSEPGALLRHPAVSADPDGASVARFLGFRFGPDERSFFRQVRQLPPAHLLHVTGDAVRVEQYWRFRRLRPAAVERTADEVGAELRHLLRSAVHAEVAGLAPEQVGVSLSGGLDSTAVAAVAPRGVRAFSWTFAEGDDGDERPRIEEVSRHLELPVHWVEGDGLHPLSADFADRFVGEASPHVNAFAALKERLYRKALEAGCRRMLVGDGGDTLYAAREYWLRDALAAGGPSAFRSLAGTVARAARGDRFARLALIRLLPGRGLRSALRGASWLTAAGRAALPPAAPSPILPPGPGGVRYELAVGARNQELEAEERRLFARCGIERGNPFWSWPLLETVIQLPATWYHRDGRSKVLAREAFRGLLPRRILEQPSSGLLGGFFLHGIEQRRDELRERVFRHPRSDWPRYVRPEWLEPYLAATDQIAFGHTILWRVISYELWIRRLIDRP